MFPEALLTTYIEKTFHQMNFHRSTEPLEVFHDVRQKMMARRALAAQVLHLWLPHFLPPDHFFQMVVKAALAAWMV